MGASHPSRLVDEQGKSAEAGDVWDSLDGAGREEPPPPLASVASLQPLAVSRTSARGLFFLWRRGHSVSPDAFYSTRFIFSLDR